MNATGGVQPKVGEDELNQAIEALPGVAHDGDADQGRDSSEAIQNSAIVMNIPVEVQVLLGSADMAVSELMSLQKGSTVALNRRIGDLVDVIVNGRKIARGEVVVLEDDPSR